MPAVTSASCRLTGVVERWRACKWLRWTRTADPGVVMAVPFVSLAGLPAGPDSYGGSAGPGPRLAGGPGPVGAGAGQPVLLAAAMMAWVTAPGRVIRDRCPELISAT